MTDQRSVAYSVGWLESWIEKAGKEGRLVVDEPLRHLKVMEDALTQYRKEARESVQRNDNE